LGEDKVLATERKVPQGRFDASQGSEESRENEVIMSEDEGEASLF